MLIKLSMNLFKWYNNAMPVDLNTMAWSLKWFLLLDCLLDCLHSAVIVYTLLLNRGLIGSGSPCPCPKSGLLLAVCVCVFHSPGVMTYLEQR